tara:strand:+ start:3408 stop:4649 length:1242 start_codon:yes stop_codon:yes gene_type:complete
MGRFISALIPVMASLWGSLLLQAAAAAEGVGQPYAVNEYWFEQPVDHDAQDAGTYRQQYFVLKPTRATVDSPVFFVLGNETDTTSETLVSLHNIYGAPEDMIFILSEHRGYGQSITSGDQSKPSYVSVRSALADYQRLIQHLKNTYTGPWIVAGYSYGGALAIHFGHHYPESADVILSSSAPIHWPFQMPEYAAQTRRNFGEAMADRMEAHFFELSRREAGADQWRDRALLTSSTVGLAQIEKFQYLLPYISLLSYLPTPWFMGALDLALPPEAYEWADTRALRQVTQENAITGKYNWYTWKYQQCSELGTFWSEDFFHYEAAEHIQDCQQTFGESPQYLENTSWDVAGMLRNTSTRTVVVSGGKDPWMQLGVKPDHDFRNIDFLYKAEGYHCPDRYDPELAKEVMTRLRSHI